jgi:hypothetical protein
MGRILRDNGLSVTLLVLVLVSRAGQAMTGWRTHAEELRLHELPANGFPEYLTSGHFISAALAERVSIGGLLVLGIYLREQGRWRPSPWLPRTRRLGTEKLRKPTFEGNPAK